MKTPLVERIYSAPADVIMLSNDLLSSLDWSSLFYKTSTAVGILLNVVLLAIKAYKGEAFADDEFGDLLAKPQFLKNKGTGKVAVKEAQKASSWSNVGTVGSSRLAY
ncbi:hypothetical protein HDU67_006099 [Dinochytrium kinnereticum]|nr:hypothetical protein HDU67_006099 [Dinochytrium kinnereticum]